MLSSPAFYGLPAHFEKWRKFQPEAVQRTLDSNKRFVVLNAPTGFGKTLYYMAVSRISKKRTAILTSTKELQDQLLRDYNECGLSDIRGKATYHCSHRYGWTCSDGFHGRCALRKTPECPYSRALFDALDSEVVSTNYAYWPANNKYGQGLGKFDLLICDEAHNAVGELESHLQVLITHKEISESLHLSDCDPSIKNFNTEYWKSDESGTMRPLC